MCGICGILNHEQTRPVDRSTLATMNRQITHRGPDDEGLFLDKNVGIAMRRLSIIDVKSGHQPLSNETGDIWIVYNGEIYNHEDLRKDMQARGHIYRTKSDTESIIHLYEEYGRDCVQHLQGMFAFVIWDQKRRILFGARDRLGIKPFYYRHENGTFLFGSEIKTILAFPGVKAEFNRSTLGEYLAFGYTSGADTMYSGIHKLMPGHWFELDEAGSWKSAEYWDLRITPDDGSLPEKHYIDMYRDGLEKAVSSHLMSDVPLGVFLSGGVDSSAVAALTKRIRKEPVETFSVGYAEAAFSELGYAQEVANHIGTKHHEVRVSKHEFFEALPRLTWHEDEPIVWPSSVALYFVAKLARERVTVVLTGEGSDETLGGYSRYALTLWNSRADAIYRGVTPSFLRRQVRSAIQSNALGAGMQRRLEHTFLGRDGACWESFYFDNFYSAFAESEQAELLTPAARSAAGSVYSNVMDAWQNSSGDLLHKLLYTDIKTYLVELLMKQDQMSMAASIESRVPFLDHKLVEQGMRIPTKYLLEGLSGKMVLKRALEDILPRDILYRKKMGFPTPWSRWLQGDQLSEVESMLTSDRCLARGLFQMEALRGMFAEHRKGRRDHTTRIWRLMNLEIWHRACIDGEVPAVAEQVGTTLTSARSL
jgi:asparagine synthase (glutamine-hydrolysing)